MLQKRQRRRGALGIAVALRLGVGEKAVQPGQTLGRVEGVQGNFVGEAERVDPVKISDGKEADWQRIPQRFENGSGVGMLRVELLEDNRPEPPFGVQSGTGGAQNALSPALVLIQGEELEQEEQVEPV